MEGICSMNDIVINVKDATKKFEKYTVLNNVNLQCYKGEICGIVGRNGSGKTVLFKSICGLVKLNSGDCYRRCYRKRCKHYKKCRGYYRRTGSFKI